MANENDGVSYTPKKSSQKRKRLSEVADDILNDPDFKKWIRGDHVEANEVNEHDEIPDLDSEEDDFNEHDEIPDLDSEEEDNNQITDFNDIDFDIEMGTEVKAPEKKIC